MSVLERRLGAAVVISLLCAGTTLTSVASAATATLGSACKTVCASAPGKAGSALI